MQVFINCLENCHAGCSPCARDYGLRTSVRIARIAKIAKFCMMYEKIAFLGALVAKFEFHVNNQYGQPNRELQRSPGDPKQGKSVKSRLSGCSRGQVPIPRQKLVRTARKRASGEPGGPNRENP